MVELSDSDYQIICNAVWDKLVENDLEDTEIYEMHNIVEAVLEEYYPVVAKMYKEYRNYKKDFVYMMDKVYEKSQTIRYIGDKNNANTDSALVATKRSLIFGELNGELYKKFFLTLNEKQAMKVVSLHLPMILAKARQESKDFYEIFELIRELHKRTYDYIGELRASVNPVAFCEGGLYGGHLKPEDKIKSILPPMTMSYGITALNELQRLYNGKSIREDGEFALEVMQYIQRYIDKIKEEDHVLYAIYRTPAESLCGLQIEQFRKVYGIIENVSDKPYVSNSFHCHVSEQMSPIEKQDKEERFWNYFNGGKIQYCRYNLGYNIEAIKTLVLRAMEKGFYEGVNLAMCYCEDCGYQQVEMDICPKCGGSKITKIDRMNGYLGFTRVHGETRYNEAKNAEIKDRVSM